MVTIVILIILATISINAVLGENGLIKRAEKAAEHRANAEAADRDAMSEIDKYLANTIAGTEGNSGGTGEDQLQISYEIEDIDASGKAVKLSYTGVEVTIVELEGMLMELMTGQAGAQMDEATRGEAQAQAIEAGMTYYDYLKMGLESLGVNTSGIETEVKQGEREIGLAKGEFIATRNGTYTVKAVANDGREKEIEVKIEGIVEEKFSEIKTSTETYAEGNLTAKIPAGFAVGISEGINTIAGGLVITDAVDENGYSIGNEYVWIPVGEDEEDFKRESFDDSTLSSSYTEPFNYTNNGTTYTGYTTEEAEYNTMKTQVLAHHGFYIARYEAGINSTEFRKYPTEGAQEVVSKRGVVPYNYVPWGASMTDINSDVECEANEGETINTKGAVYLAKNIYTGKTQANSVTSTLCYGVQWDAMCRYIEDYTRTTDTKLGVDVTGRIGVDNSKNIYDLAGNCYEWTMEAGISNSRVLRGGFYGNSLPVSYRNGLYPTNGKGFSSFRSALYISAPES